MNRLFRKFTNFAFALRKFGEISISERGFLDGCNRHILLPSTKVNGFCTEKEHGVEKLHPICDVLRKGGRWECLDARLATVELSNSLVDGVLLKLREPNDAKGALAFFHWCSRRKDFRHGIRSYCIMIHILVRAALVLDARALLESVILQNSGSESTVFSIAETLLSTYGDLISGPKVFDFLIQSYSNLRMFDIAFRACIYLGEHGFLPSLISFNTMLHVVQRSDQNVMVWKIYEYMISRRVYPNESTVETMINSMCKEGTLLKVLGILDKICGKRCTPPVVVNTALSIRMIEENKAEEGIVLLKRMLQKNIILDDVACSLTVFAHCKMGDLQMAYDAYDYMLKRGHCMNSYVCTLLIGFHCRKGNMEDAKCLMHEMSLAGLKPYDETYNLLMECCCRLGRLEESLDFHHKMLERGYLPSCNSANEIIRQLCDRGNAKDADNILTVLLNKGFIPNELTYINLINGFGKAGRYQDVLKLYNEMEWKGPTPSIATYTSVIRSLCKCEKLKDAEKILKIMQQKALVPSREICGLIAMASERIC